MKGVDEPIVHNFLLPTKIMPALRWLLMHYNKKDLRDLSELIESSRVYIDLGVDYDNLNGGMYGHNVILFVPYEMMKLVDLDGQDDIFDKLKIDLNKAIPELDREYIVSVFVKPIDQGDPQCQESIPFTLNPSILHSDVDVWQGNKLRLFISHRDKHKKYVHELANELFDYGICSFVAHESIKPTREWQDEIFKALSTMEVMLVFLTDDFHDSVWTNQEVGFALGKKIPIICLKLGESNPQGFLASKQALRSNLSEIPKIAIDLQKILISEIGGGERLIDIMINSFINSKSYTDTIRNFKKLSEVVSQLSDSQLSRILEGYEKNDQIYSCIGIHTLKNNFREWLESITGRKFKIKNNKIIEEDQDNDFPF